MPLNDTSLGTVWNGLESWVTFSVIGAYEMSWCQNTHGGVRHLFAKGEHQNRYINDVINERCSCIDQLIEQPEQQKGTAKVNFKCPYRNIASFLNTQYTYGGHI